MSKLSIENYTKWSTNDIRAAVRFAEQYHELKLDRLIIVKNARARGMRGRAALPFDRGSRRKPYTRHGIEGRRVKLYLPPEPPKDMEKFRRDFAWLVLHELAHNAGLSHLDMGVASQLNKVWGSTEMPRGMEAFAAPAWEGATAKTKAAVLAATVDAREAKTMADIERWEAALAKRESLVRRAKRKLSALRARAAYYARRRAGVAERLTSRPANGTMSGIEQVTRAAAKEPTKC